MLDVIITVNHSPWSRYCGGGQKSAHMLARAFAEMGLRVGAVFTKAPWERVPVPGDLPYELHWAAFAALRPGMSSALRWMNGLSVCRTVLPLCDGETTLIGNGDEASWLGHVHRRRRLVYCHRYPNPAAWLTGVSWHRASGWLHAGVREPRYWAMAMAIRAADLVACTSTSSLRQLVAAFPMGAHKAAVVPNGIDPAFSSCPVKSAAGRGILFFGRFTEEKGLRELLAAFGALPAGVQRAHPLTLVGRGPLSGEARAASVRNSCITVRDWMDSDALARQIVAHKVVALPSRAESFGNTMLEALAVGQDVVTCAAGSVPEVVEDQAVLLPPRDPAALCRALSRAVDQPFDPAAGARRRAWVQARFSWDTTARRLLA